MTSHQFRTYLLYAIPLTQVDHAPTRLIDHRKSCFICGRDFISSKIGHVSQQHHDLHVFTRRKLSHNIQFSGLGLWGTVALMGLQNSRIDRRLGWEWGSEEASGEGAREHIFELLTTLDTLWAPRTRFPQISQDFNCRWINGTLQGSGRQKKKLG